MVFALEEVAETIIIAIESLTSPRDPPTELLLSSLLLSS